MLPVVALVGRPNVGKSTLFNRLTRSRDALVDNQPGVTRDRLYGRGRIGRIPFLVVDTGGIESEDNLFSRMVEEQVDQVIEEADMVMFLVDAVAGLVMQDREIAQRLRVSGRKIHLLVNKSEGFRQSLVTSEFQELSLGTPVAISAKRGDGIENVILDALGDHDDAVTQEQPGDSDIPKFALVGRPNVGKSTLTNRLVGEHRVIVHDLPGTTRDSVNIPVSIEGKDYILIDTAGVRKKSKVEEVIEKFSVIKTLQAIENSQVVLLIVDASTEIGSQDAAIAGMVNDSGRSIVIVVNKWDGLDNRKRNRIIRDIESKFSFLPGPELVTISALHGSNIKEVIPAANRAYDSAMVSIATSNLNRALADAIVQTPPPMNNQRPVKMKFAHQAGRNPPVIVIHGNQVDSLPKSYLRYLSRYFSKAYGLKGTPLRILTRVSENPFKRRNPSKKSFKERTSGRRKL